MAAPTRAQIEAAFALPKYKVELWNDYLVTGGWTTVTASTIVSISGSIESTGNQVNGLSFGTTVEPSLSVTLENVGIGAHLLISDPYWLQHRMRISFGFDTSDYVVQFIGVITDIQINNKDATLQLKSLMEYIRDTKLYTPIYYHMPVATKTTIASVENPDDVNFQAGMVNLIFFRAGGRPYEQKDINYTESSTGFKFWYSCQQSLFSPEYLWLSGENLIDELYLLARATGAQIYQDASGVIRYIDPLSFGDTEAYGGTYFIFTDAMFDGFSQRLSDTEMVRTVTATYTPRQIAPLQDVYEDKTPIVFLVNETKYIVVNPSLPIWSYINLTPWSLSTSTANIRAQLIDGHDITPGIGDIEADATRVSIQVWAGSLTVPSIIYSIKLQGQPLSAGSKQQIAVGSGTPEMNIEDNVYIQTKDHAERLAKLVYDFYYDARPIITLTNVQYDPDRYVGEIVKVQSTYNRIWNGSTYSTNTTLYRIIKIAHDNVGTSMSVDLVSLSGIVSRGDMFILGETYAGSDNRQMSY